MTGLQRISWALILTCGLVAGTIPIQAAIAQTEENGGGEPDSIPQCLDCHATPRITSISQTPHGQKADPRTPAAAQLCETCHFQFDQHPEIVPGRPTGQQSWKPTADQNKACLGCHEGGLRTNWPGSQHESADTPCAACHEIHSPKDKVLLKTSQPEVCFGCHAERRAQLYRRSRHPIKEGKVACSDCHSPHGSAGPTLLRKVTVNETCYQCHTEKRGPFLWEHAPVRDECTNCHTPHGSSQVRLLKIRPPFLCQQCHMEAFHPSTVYSGTGIPPAGAAERLLAKGCLNCHSKIHGSNHPSGVRFTR